MSDDHAKRLEALDRDVDRLRDEVARAAADYESAEQASDEAFAALKAAGFETVEDASDAEAKLAARATELLDEIEAKLEDAR